MVLAPADPPIALAVPLAIEMPPPVLPVPTPISFWPIVLSSLRSGSRTR